MCLLKIKKLVNYLIGLVIFLIFMRGYSYILNSSLRVDDMNLLLNIFY